MLYVTTNQKQRIIRNIIFFQHVTQIFNRRILYKFRIACRISTPRKFWKHLLKQTVRKNPLRICKISFNFRNYNFFLRFKRIFCKQRLTDCIIPKFQPLFEQVCRNSKKITYTVHTSLRIMSKNPHVLCSLFHFNIIGKLRVSFKHHVLIQMKKPRRFRRRSNSAAKHRQFYLNQRRTVIFCNIKFKTIFKNIPVKPLNFR